MNICKRGANMNVLIIILIAILYSSLVEYSLHRWYLHHNNNHPHIKRHHAIFYGKQSFQLQNIPRNEIVSSAVYLGVNIVCAVPISILLIFQKQSMLGVIFLVISASYILWIEVAHLNFHRPNKFPLKKYAWFLYIMELHRKHHTTYRHYYGIGSPWWDYLLGTTTKV